MKNKKKPAITQPKNQLVITKNSSDKQTKQQIEFNKLTSRIERLKADIQLASKRLDSVLNVYHNEFKPLAVKRADKELEFAALIDKKSQLYKLTNSQTEQVRTIILHLCNNAFVDKIPSEEQEELFDKWSQVSYKEEVKNIEDATKNEFAEMLNDMFDMDINPNEIGNTEEDIAKFTAQFEAKLKEKYQSETSSNNKRETKLEARKKAEEQLLSKNLRNLYLTLVKLLHPDNEIDEQIKIEKQEKLKQVTVAYENKDLASLLIMETEWIHAETDHLNQLSDEKLKLYNSVLKQQIDTLKSDLQMISMHPRYSEIPDIFKHSKPAEQIQIIKMQQTIISEVSTNIIILSVLGQKTELTRYISKTAKLINDIRDDFGLMAEFFEMLTRK